jgi:hypothetical protein
MQTLGEKTPSAVQAQNSNDGGDDLSSFLEFLSKPETSIPLNSNFLLAFDIPLPVKEGAFSAYEQSTNDWNTLAAPRKKLLDIFDTGLGFKKACIFSNGISLPQESYSTQREGNNNAGIVQGVVSSSRRQQEVLQTTFLETNQSFIDFVMRTWIILGSHYGLIARNSPATNIKTTMTAIFYDRFLQNKARKVYRFYGCVPVAIVNSGYATHDFGTSKIDPAKIEWVYNYYTVSNSLDRG